MTLAAAAPNNLSDHNPFRQRLQVTPQPTGALNSPPASSALSPASIAGLEHQPQIENPFEPRPSSSNSAPPSSANPSAAVSSPNPTYQPPPGPPPPTTTFTSPNSPPPSFEAQSHPTEMAHATPPHPQSTTSPTSNRRDILDDPTEDELPPAYTPSADVRSGETTVEYGPRRPFQTAPARPNPHATNLHPNATGSSSSFSSLGYSGNGRRGGGGLLSQLANQLQDLTMRTVSPHSTGMSSSYPPPSRPPPSPVGAAAYPGQQQQQHRIYAPPAAPPPPPRPAQPQQNASTVVTPPEGATSDFARDFYAAGADVNVEAATPSTDSTGGLGTTNSAAAGGEGLAPGKPTTTPTPGHPYLHDNMLLVYPKGYECDKCHNIGYKLPGLKPCKKCWPKYGKPFTGPLAYSFGESTSTSENFQRPLPPPPSPTHRPPPTNNYPGTASGSSHYSNPNSYSAPSSYAPPTAPPPPPLPPTLSSSSWNNYNTGPGQRPGFGSGFGPSLGSGGGLGRAPTSVYARGRPPPGAIVYSAGDMRLGGKRCWRCEGDGTISFMLFDREQCPVCGGIGRTY